MIKEQVIIITALLLMGFALGVSASSHNFEVTAYERAVSNLKGKGCLEYRRDGTPKYEVRELSDGVYTVEKPPYRIECVKWKALITIEMRWSAPKLRENGSPLKPSEISHYELYIHNGETFEILETEDTMLRHNLPQGSYAWTMSCVDTNGFKNEASDPIRFTVSA